MRRHDAWAQNGTPEGIEEVGVPRHLGGVVRYFICACGRRCRFVDRDRGRWCCWQCTGSRYASAAAGPGTDRRVIVTAILRGSPTRRDL